LKQAEYYNELLWMKLKLDDFPVGENSTLEEGRSALQVRWCFILGTAVLFDKTGDNESNIEASSS